MSQSVFPNPFSTRSGKSLPGTGKGGFSKHGRKVLKDNIFGITKPAIRRLARRGGVKRISAQIYEETRGILGIYIRLIMGPAVTYLEYKGTMTMTPEEIVYSLKFQSSTVGTHLYGVEYKR